MLDKNKKNNVKKDIKKKLCSRVPIYSNLGTCKRYPGRQIRQLINLLIIILIRGQI